MAIISQVERPLLAAMRSHAKKTVDTKLKQWWRARRGMSAYQWPLLGHGKCWERKTTDETASGCICVRQPIAASLISTPASAREQRQRRRRSPTWCAARYNMLDVTNAGTGITGSMCSSQLNQTLDASSRKKKLLHFLREKHLRFLLDKICQKFLEFCITLIYMFYCINT